MQRGTVALARSAFKRQAKPKEKKPSKLAPALRARSRRATAAERRYMGCVAAFGCILCLLVFGHVTLPVHVHHLKAGGGSKRASHFDTMPLCYEHHLGATGIHMLGQEGFERFYGLTETALLAYFKAKLGANHG